MEQQSQTQTQEEMPIKSDLNSYLENINLQYVTEYNVFGLGPGVQ
jgi:hypothetical protein